MNTPYYQDDSVTLYHGDCLEITEWLAADVLVTDPPYGIGWKQGDYDGGAPKGRNQNLVRDGIANDDSTEARDAVLRMWGNQGPAFVFGSFKAAFPTAVVQTLVWRKAADVGVVGSTTGYRTDTELIFLCGKHPRRSASRSSVLESRGGSNRYRNDHPHAKPPLILEQLIEWTDGVVADPFAGSGSTLVAARNLGRKAIGVELEERYCELVARRLDQMAIDFGSPA